MTVKKKGLYNQTNAKKVIKQNAKKFIMQLNEEGGVNKASLRDQADAALNEWRNRQPTDRRTTLDDVLRKRY